MLTEEIILSKMLRELYYYELAMFPTPADKYRKFALSLQDLDTADKQIAPAKKLETGNKLNLSDSFLLCCDNEKLQGLKLS